MKPETGINEYEKAYFKRFFGTDIKKLQYFRKTLSKDQKEGWDRGCGRVTKYFMVEGGREMAIELNRRKVDAYIKLIENGEV